MKYMPYVYGGLIGAAAAALVFYMVMQAQKAKENKSIKEAEAGPVVPPVGTDAPLDTTMEPMETVGARSSAY